LRRTLESITAQTYKNLEIIVSDNCSDSKEVKAVVSDFMKSDSRIKYFRQNSNMGPTFNLKFVLENSTGDYFMWAADDDEWDGQYIMKLVEILSSNPHVSVAACQTAYRLAGTSNVYPLFQQGLPFNRVVQNSLRQRLRLAARENFGELFYGVFRRSSLFLNHSSSIDFECCGLIHVALRALLSGDACVIRDFLFKKDVNEDAFVWTYLCAKAKNPSVASEDLDNYISQRSKGKTSALTSIGFGSKLKDKILLAMKSVYSSLRWHFLFLVSSLVVIFRSNVRIGDKAMFASYILPCLLRSTAWTVYARIKYM
jgi:glycosyltransferase involved in cell wall biosynthesis